MKNKILCLTLMISTLFISACSQPTDTPQTIAKYFITNTYSGDGAALTDAFHLTGDLNTSHAKQLLITEMSMAAQEAKKVADKNGGVSSINIKDVQYSNNEKTHAIVDFTVKFKKDGAEDIGAVKTIKTDKGWKISLKN